MTEIALLSPDDIILADDSGLEIDYLNREPGIYSARYLGEDTSYDIKPGAFIPSDWCGKRTQERAVCMRDRCGGSWKRGIYDARYGRRIYWLGDGWFQWLWLRSDFYVDAYGCSTAELTMEQKNALSHRGNALRAMKEELIKKGVLA